jgi:cytochrome P450
MSDPFSFNPLDPETRRHPYPFYARGRSEFPVHLHAGLPFRLFSVFRYHDVQSILRDPETWSNAFTQVLASTDLGPLPPPNMLVSDPPQHTRLRSLVNKAFTPRIIQRLEPRMHEVASELLSAALATREVDLMEALAYPLPVVVIAEIIGIPPEDRDRFKAWSDQVVASLGLAFLAGLDLERVKRQRRLLDEMRSYFVPLAEERRRDPREDLLTGLVQAEHEGSRLSYDEMLGMLVLLLIAGNETTTNLIGNAALELLARPELAREMRAEPDLLPSLVEEVLRFSSPVQFAPRLCTRSVELHGVEIERGNVALCWIGSANRDEKVFEHPEDFDPRRGKSPHLAFGFGAHYCLGANLARLEAQVAIGALLARTRHLERTDESPLPLHPSPVFRAVTKLPVRLEPA